MSKILNENQKKVKFALFVYFDLLKIQTIYSFFCYELCSYNLCYKNNK